MAFTVRDMATGDRQVIATAIIGDMPQDTTVVTIMVLGQDTGLARLQLRPGLQGIIFMLTVEMVFGKLPGGPTIQEAAINCPQQERQTARHAHPNLLREKEIMYIPTETAMYTVKRAIAGSNGKATSGKMPPMPAPGIFKAGTGKLAIRVTDTSSNPRPATDPMCRIIALHKMLIESNKHLQITWTGILISVTGVHNVPSNITTTDRITSVQHHLA